MSHDLAEAIEKLISLRHDPAAVWNYTPREITGYLQLARHRHKQDVAEQLNIIAMGSRGEPKELQKYVRELVRE